MAHLAAAEHHEDLLKYLVLKTDFDFKLKDRWNNTPLDEIKDPVLKNDIEELLLRHRPSWKKSQDMTPI